MWDLFVSLNLDANKFVDGLDRAERKSTAAGNSIVIGLSKIGGGIVLGAFAAAGAGAVALGVGLMGSIKAASEAADIQAQLEAVLHSTGGAAGVTADMVNDLATNFSQFTKFEDDAIVSGQNMLLTFTNIGKDVFPAVTKTMLNMSQAMGTDLKSTAIQLGKALNDPAEGLSALTRVGVTFSEEQEKMIKTMMKAGDTAGAQGVMLAELQKEFGGSAEAAGQTFAGQLVILQNKLGNVKETIGTALLPVLAKLSSGFSDWLGSSAVQNGIATITNGITALADAFMIGFGPDGDIIAGITNALYRFGMQYPILNTLGDAIIWISESFGTVVMFFQNNEGVIVGILAALGVAVVTWSITTITAIAPIIVAMLPVIAIMAAVGVAAYLLYQAWTTYFGGIQEKAAAVWAAVQPVLAQLATWLKTNIPIAIAALVSFWNGTLLPTFEKYVLWVQATLFPIFKTLWDWLATNVPAAINTLVGFWNGTLMPALQAAWSWINTNLVPLFKALGEVLSVTVGLAATALAGIWQNVLQPALKVVGDFISTNLQPVLKSLSDFLSGTVGPVVNDVAGFVGTALAGAFDGVTTAIQGAIGWLSTLADNLKKITLPPWMTPGSPTPWEIGLLGVNDAFHKLTSTGLADFNAEINAKANVDVPGLMRVGGGNTSSQTTNNYNITAQYPYRDESSLMRDVKNLALNYGG